MRRSGTCIRTDRLWLRQIDETDAEAIVSIRSDESVYQFFTNPVKLTVDEHLSWYRDIYSENSDRIDWIAVDDKAGTFIGVYGVKRDDDGSVVEISYITKPEHKGHGYAAEAVEAIIRWSLENWDTNRFVVRVHEDNKASLKFAETMGFILSDRIGQFRVMEKTVLT